MNQKNISSIFDRYIDKFGLVSDEQRNEDTIWAAVNNFQKLFDVDAPDFSTMLKLACDSTGNIIDDYLQPFRGLVRMAEQDGEAETIREMFRDLFSNDETDLNLKQMKIERFIEKSDQLTEKHYPGSLLYKNDQRSVMGYLWFYDPANNFMYTNVESEYFSKAVELPFDWQEDAQFMIEKYYRFCEQIIKEMKEKEELLQINSACSGDENLHVLLFDMIHSSFEQDLYKGLKIRKYTIDQRKQFHEDRIKAIESTKELVDAEQQKIRLNEAMNKVLEWAESGADIVHKSFGKGEIKALDGKHITLRFPDSDETKKFQLTSAVGGGFLKFDVNEFEKYMEDYGYVLNHATTICNHLDRLRNKFSETASFIK